MNPNNFFHVLNPNDFFLFLNASPAIHDFAHQYRIIHWFGLRIRIRSGRIIIILTADSILDGWSWYCCSWSHIGVWSHVVVFVVLIFVRVANFNWVVETVAIFSGWTVAHLLRIAELSIVCCGRVCVHWAIWSWNSSFLRMNFAYGYGYGFGCASTRPVESIGERIGLCPAENRVEVPISYNLKMTKNLQIAKNFFASVRIFY